MKKTMLEKDYVKESVAAFQTAYHAMADKLNELWEAERDKK